MSGEFRTLNSFTISSLGFRLIGLISFILATGGGLASGVIFVDNNVVAQFYLIYLLVMALTMLAIIFPSERPRVIFSSLLIIFYSYAVLLSIPYFLITVPLVVALAVELKQFNSDFRLKSQNGFWLLAFAAAVTGMIMLSGLLRGFPSTQSIGILVASISDDVQPGGTPLLFLGGIVYFTHYFVFSISVQALLLFTVLSFLLVENYFLIIRFVRKNSRSVIGGQVSGALTVLSCQCESITAAFPSIVSLILSAAIVPLIMESIILVFLTNFLLRKYFMVGKRSRILDSVYPLKKRKTFSILSASVIILLPLLETIGVYFGLQSNLYFFGGINFIMFIGGILAGVLTFNFVLPSFRFGSRMIPAILAAISSVAMLVWFYPALTAVTISNAGIYAAMSVISFAGGILSGIVYHGIREGGKYLFLEFLAMMFTMFAILIFYISILFAYNIWPAFNLTDQVIFSIGLWVVTLPLMWLSTNIALNGSVNNGKVNFHEN